MDNNDLLKEILSTFKPIIGILALVLGWKFGGVFFNAIMRAFPENAEQISYNIAVIAGGAGAGLICGLVPNFIGKRRNRRRLGKIALYSCIVSGIMLGVILALPVAVGFSIAIIAIGYPTIKEKPTVDFEKPAVYTHSWRDR